MVNITKPIKIGSSEIPVEMLEALRIRRDYKRLREIAGWRSSMIDKEVSVLKDLLGDELVSKSNERIARQKQATRRPFTGYSY